MAVELDPLGIGSVNISMGGTGADTAGQALSNLGGQPANADLTTLSSGTFAQKRALVEASAKHITNIASLRLTTADFSGDSRYLISHTSLNDGGNGTFVWDPTSEDDDNNGTIIQVTGTGTGRWIRQYTVATPRMYGAQGNGVAYDTGDLDTCFSNHRRVHNPLGRYLYAGDGIIVLPYSNITGDGVQKYIFNFGEDITGTTLIQSTANPIFITDTGVPEDSHDGQTTFRDMTLLGGTVANHPGTYGALITDAESVKFYNMYASFFAIDGINYTGGLVATVRDSRITYAERYGLSLDYGTYGGGDANSYQSIIDGCRLLQNAEANLHLGVSTFNVHVTNCDIESAGNYYSANGIPDCKGYGVYISSESNQVVIDHSWFEGNKYHLVIGNDALTSASSTQPKNTVIDTCQFWAVHNDQGTDDNVKIVLNAGRRTQIKNCNFYGESKIKIGPFSGNPILENNNTAYGLTLIDSNDNEVTYDPALPEIDADAVNLSNLLYTSLYTSLYTFNNCSVAVDYTYKSPAGNVPVYAITPTTAADIDFGVTGALPYLKRRNTYGFYARRATGSAPVTCFPVIARTSPLKVYTNATLDTVTITDEWQWFSLGFHVDAADTGNFTIRFDVEDVTDTDPVYFSSIVAISGIYTKPYLHTTPPFALLSRPSTLDPSVYGLETVTTSGAWGPYETFLNGSPGQLLTVFAAHTTTYAHNVGNIHTLSGSTLTQAANTVQRFVCNNVGDWYQL